jgi:AbrB family looped-hinge helix DNA binding protein
MITLHSKVGERGQVVIPKPIRDMFKIEPDDEMSFKVDDGRIIIEPTDPKGILEDYLSEIPRKKEPKEIDWDEEYGSQFGG